MNFHFEVEVAVLIGVWGNFTLQAVWFYPELKQRLLKKCRPRMNTLAQLESNPEWIPSTTPS